VIVFGVRGCVLLGHGVFSRVQKGAKLEVDYAFPGVFRL
jgi:hypothetical protein